MSKRLTDNSIGGMLNQIKIQNVQGIEAYNSFYSNDNTFDQDVLGSYKDAGRYRGVSIRKAC